MTNNSETKQPAENDLLKRLIVGALVGAGVYAAFNWQAVSVYLFGASAYTCDNLVPQVVDIADKNGGVFNVKLIGIINPTMVSKTNTRIECKGQGVFATGIKMPIAYRAHEEGGQWWIFYEATP
ncbi:hypothetical protein [Agrobacterium tumefaciens]|uniref:hypothetical protein n=1 Tax=Agrobacterium tumefaciens TaxID=358 RepID=UPI000DD0CB82|nr:hypothetical protein [Agrobacterium tumefaciens]